MFTVGGICGSIFYGFLLEIRKKYKLYQYILSVTSIISIIFIIFSFMLHNAYLTSFSMFMAGFSLLSMNVVGVEFGVEITYPMDEAFSCGMLNCFGNLFGIIWVRINAIRINEYRV
jgi:predicted MFS family arabinose efflux permease